MVAIILCLFRFIRLLGSGHQGVAVENLALRLQLAAFRRKRKRPILTQLDRLFLGSIVPGLERLARHARIRSAGHSSPVAARAIPKILGAAVSAQAWSEREVDHRDRDSTVGVADSYRQSSVASTENSW